MKLIVLKRISNLLMLYFILISQVCHVVLGLKPQTKEDEGKVIRSVNHHYHYLFSNC